MTSSAEGFRFNGVAMIRQWSRRPEFGNEGKRTSSIRRRVFWRDLSGEITSHARPRWHTTVGKGKEGVKRRGRGERKRGEGEGRKSEERGRGKKKDTETCDNLIVVVSRIRGKVVSSSPCKNIQQSRTFLSFAPSFFLAYFSIRAFDSVRSSVTRPSARKKQLKRLKSPTREREREKRDGKACEFLLCSSTSLFSTSSASVLGGWRWLGRRGCWDIASRALELPRAIAPESNFHSDLLFEQEWWHATSMA